MDTVTISNILSEFLTVPQITNVGGFASVFFQISAVLAGARALINKKTVKLKQGRPILVVNFGVAEDEKPYGSNGSISAYREIYAGQEGGDTVIYFYHSASGDIGVNQELAEWGKDGNEYAPTLRAPRGGEIPEDRWLSEWAAYRHGFGCPTPEGRPYLAPPREQDCLEATIKALTTRFKYETLHLWGERGKGVISSTFIPDDEGSAEKLCNYFEERCENEYEKTCSIMALTRGSVVINIFSVTNIVSHDLSNINIFIGGHGHHTGTVVKSAADVEGMEIINQSWQVSQVRLKTLPAKATRYLLIQSRAPLSKSDITIESGLTNKYGVSTLRKIALTALVITATIFLTTINSTAQTEANKPIQPTPKSGAADG